MSRKWGYVAFLIVFVLFIWVISHFHERPIAFTSITDAKTKLEAKGFHCNYDNDSRSGGFLVSTKPMSREEVASLTESRSRNTLPNNVAWFETMKDQGGFTVIPNGAVRMMGCISVQGDKQFLDFIEASLRK